MCEVIHIPEQFDKDDCIPCQKNFTQYLKCLEVKSSGQLNQVELNLWFSECHSNATCWQQLQFYDCINNGTCQVIVGQCNFFMILFITISV